MSWPSLASLEPQAWRREKWGLLTDDDLDVINERQEQLEGKIQERYGLASLQPFSALWRFEQGQLLAARIQ